MAELHLRRDTILVVDDTPETLGFLTDTLDHAGLTVLIATDGETALELVDQITPDLVLMDAVMPGMNGFETCRRMKQEKQLTGLPVIFMTGLSETEHVVEGLAAGGVDYVIKPIVVDELLARIRVHLANARVAQGTRAALDATGRFLLATDRAGKLLWCTPKARQLLGELFTPAGWSEQTTSGFAQPGEARLNSPQTVGLAATAISAGRKLRPAHGSPVPPQEALLPPAVVEQLMRLRRDSSAQPRSVLDIGGRRLEFSMLSPIGPDELLFRVAEVQAGGEERILQQALQLTSREAEVLLWISRGKANREIGEILTISPRTVNKHLEQIFVKLGVENRAAAAARAVRALAR